MNILELPNNQKIEFEQGIIFVGANGSGKTRLGSWIENESPQKEKVVRVTAQKSLDMPDDCSPMDIERAQKQLLYGNPDVQPDQFLWSKTTRKFQNKPNTVLVNDYKDLFVYLFSEHSKEASDYLDKSKLTPEKITPPNTSLDKIIKIWEEIIPNKKLINNGTSISVKTLTQDNDDKYKSSEMSDGERVLFYLIGKCLCVPSEGIIIIDEPELHLHKTIQYSLWDKIEKIKSDCTFVYLTHDVEFASSRVGFKKIWIKSYDGKNWELEDIGNEIDLPEELLLEIYGNRKKVLFVEGENNSYDVNLFRNIFENFFVKPVGSCENVVNYTKSLRKNKDFHQIEVFGLIDKDRRTEEEIKSLEKEGIFSLKIAEVENLFAVPELIKIVCDKLEKSSEYTLLMDKIKKFVFKELKNELDIQISQRVIEEVKFLIKGIDIKSKNKQEINDNFKQEIKKIKINNIFNKISLKFDRIINNSDYEKLLIFYNRKTIASRIGGQLGLKDDELPLLILRMVNSGNIETIHKIKVIVKKYIKGDLSNMIELNK